MSRFPTLRGCLALATAASLAAVAWAQVDAGSTWPQFKANSARKGAVLGVDAPAVVPGWRTTGVGNCSAGGLTLGSNNSIYFKSNDINSAYVFRINATTGAIQAQSVNLSEAGGGTGGYAGVAVGVNEVYTTMLPTATRPTRIIVLDKTTLAILREYTSAAFVSLRGTPLISTITDVNGHHTLYVADRNGNLVHAVDATNGTVRWSQNITSGGSILGQIGPLWVTGSGKQAIGYFRNIPAPGFSGIALEDNGNSTPPNVLWEGGPVSFNWWGSGALNADGSAIYVTTFNDGDVPSLWKISTADGSIIWSVPGMRGTPDERSYFARPCVIGNRIYCGGGLGVVTCFVDEGATYSVAWEQRDGRGEITGCSAVRTAAGDVYVYGVAQEAFVDNTTPLGYAEMRVLKDTGSSFCEVYRTSLGTTMKPTRFASNTAVINANGDIYFAGGIPGTDPDTGGEIYEFTLGTTLGACCFNDGTCQVMTCEDCSGAGGSFLSAGTTCDPNPCPQPGACCVDGGCQQMLEPACLALGGEFIGEGVDCDPSPCIRGACCLPGGGCTYTWLENCTALGGTYQGDGVQCFDYTVTPGSVAMEDIVATGTHLPAGEPAEDATFTIPIGFNFNFYGNTYTNVGINDNGYIRFSGGDGPQSWVPEPFPTATEPNDMVAIAWTDMSSRLPLTSGEPNGVFYENRTNPDRLIIQYQRVSTFTGNPTAVDESTYQVILYASGDIECRWGSLDIFLVDGIAVSGLENADGSLGVTGPVSTSNNSVLYSPNNACAGGGCAGTQGDANCDGAIDFFDIDPFLLALFDNPTYLATFCGGSNCAADVDCSGAVDFFDIDRFLDCLFNSGPCPPASCP